MYPNQNINPFPGQGQMIPDGFQPQGAMFPPGNQFYGHEKMEELERKVARLERQMERLEMRVRRIESGYPVPLSTGRETTSDTNHYMM